MQGLKGNMRISFVVVSVYICAGEAEAVSGGLNPDVSQGSPGIGNVLEEKGIEYNAGITNLYQQDVHKDARSGEGRYTGSYDIELNADLAELLGLGDAGLYVHGEGSWPREDLDAASIESLFGVNGDAGGRRTLDITEFWYEQSLSNDSLFLRVGKLDVTGGFQCHGCEFSFDGSRYANDETMQFINGALVNNPTIPFPDNGLGAIVHWHAAKRWYMSIGVVDAMADARETGFRSTFHGSDHFFYIFETGVESQLPSSNGPMHGVYRIGVWNDPRPKAHSDSSDEYRDDVGFYVNFDQMLTREDADDDSQGLGLFGRYGYAPGRTNDITDFWSVGLQYRGLIEGRDHDVLGLGFGQGFLSDGASATYSADYESAAEIYYNIAVNERIHISPGIQYVTHPGGSDRINDVAVFGIRLQMTF